MTNGDLHEEQPATRADWAAFEFEPVPLEALGDAPTYAGWTKMSRTHLATLFFAGKILGATKEELKRFVRENDDMALDELLQGLASARNTFESFYRTTRAAGARLICAGPAAELEAKRQPRMSMKAA
jgi:hypothetical protein